MTPPSLYILLTLNRVENLMSNNTINIALIGYGFVGKTFHAPLIRSVPGLNLAFVASRDEEKVKRDLPDVTVIASPEAAVQHPDVDLVVIASPNATHAPLARLALNAGKHVVVDKPFTLDMQEARELIALAEEKQRLLSVFHNRRWDSDYLGIRQVIEQGAIGTVKHFESHFDRFRPEVRVRWREQNVPGSGLWFDLGPHLIDQALQLFGLPQSVQGNIATLRDGAEINDWAHVVLNYPAHKAILHCSMLVAGGSSRFTVHGDKGSVVKARADQQESQLLAGVEPGSAGWGQDDDKLVIYDASLQAHSQATPQGDQRQYYMQIRDALNGQIANPVPPVEALAVMAVLEAAVRAAESGMVQTLDLTDEERNALR
ncbi:oxidoreductase [Klebsiella variicola]|uniref:oxidoreductase n=1 Tax=Klebsiella variicola TaxID=244366 RepID=UPI000D74FB42|nr:oxidoreductase [Klebsiella variicola]PXM29345.1 oxidoreductase [Klebsiella variicola]SXE38266.1 putative oxidoreductase [Klebsiella variicola]